MDIDIASKLFPNITTLIVQLLATAVMLCIFKKFLWKPMQNYFAKRADYIEGTVNDAKNMQQKAKALMEASEEQSRAAAKEYRNIVEKAKIDGRDLVIIDTAGRLHNKINLMNELTKIKNVMKKVIPDAPHEVLLVLDGSTGQNAFEQAKQFTAATEVNALAVTKLDGTAKGGVVIGISDHFRIPVKYIGLGEGMEDLQVFNKKEFVNSLFGE